MTNIEQRLFYFCPGMTASVVGIFLCWVCPARRSTSRRSYHRGENESGFGLPGYSGHTGYCNHGLALDLPPAYADLDRASVPASGNSRHSDTETSDVLSQLPPDYAAAIKSKGSTIPKSDEHSSAFAVENEPAPPVYQEISLT